MSRQWIGGVLVLGVAVWSLTGAAVRGDSADLKDSDDELPHLRTKRSYEFLVGLVNNNSQLTEIRDTSRVKSDQPDGTSVLLELLSKIVAYPKEWNRIHQALRNLDKDLTSTQQFYNKEKEKLEEFDRKLNEVHVSTRPEFENHIDGTMDKHDKNERHFVYHKVIGKPPHRKVPTAYVAVLSADSLTTPKTSEEVLLESELHRLKPWKNKNTV